MEIVRDLQELNGGGFENVVTGMHAALSSPLLYAGCVPTPSVCLCLAHPDRCVGEGSSVERPCREFAVWMLSQKGRAHTVGHIGCA